MLSAAMDAEPVDAEGAVPSESLERHEAQEPKKRRTKVRKKKVPQDVAPETAHPQAVDFESLHTMLAVRHQDLEQKLEAWMQRQEDMVLKLEKKLIRPHFGPAEEEDAEATSAPSKPASEERPRTNSSFQSLKTMAKALTQRTDSLEEAPAKTAPVEMSPTQPVEAMNTEVDSPQVDINRVISAVAREGSHSKEKKKKNKIRNSKEVQDFYMEQMRRQMKRTRHVIISTEVTWQERLGNFMASPKFEIGMMLLSVTSAVVVGVEVNWFAHNLDANQPPEILTIINHVLTMLFGVELMMKVLVLQMQFFRVDTAWHCLDVLVVSTGMIELVIDIVNLSSTCAGANCSESDGGGPDLSILRALRIARAVRLVRLARLVQYIRELRRLILSVAGTLKAVFWAIVLLTLIIYSFAVIFQQAVNDHEQAIVRNITAQSPADAVVMDKYFNGLARTAMTLLQTATGGVSWIEVEASLQTISPLLVITFLCYFSFIYFAVLNVVTGVFCSSAIESASEDAEALIDDHLRRSKEYSERLLQLFKQLDTDQSMTVSILEFEEMFDDPGTQALFSTLGINEEKAWKLFEILDEDNDGEIDADEFVSRCFKLKGSAQRVDTERIYACLKRQGSVLEEIAGYMNDVLRGITSLRLTLDMQKPQRPRSGLAKLASISAAQAAP